jgi:hypothetical protein
MKFLKLTILTLNICLPCFLEGYAASSEKLVYLICETVCTPSPRVFTLPVTEYIHISYQNIFTKSTILGDVTPCSLVRVYIRFEKRIASIFRIDE